MNDELKLLVEWSSPWQEFLSAIRPALGRSPEPLDGEAPIGLFPYRGMLASWIVEGALFALAIMLTQTIGRLGRTVGVTLNPGTPVAHIQSVIGLVDLVLVMSVNPGFGGQAFIPEAIERVKEIRQMADGRPIRIEVDGGVGPANAGLLAAAGADAFVAGSAVFKGGKDAYRAHIAAIREAADSARSA